MKIVVLIKQVPDTYGERTLNTSTGLLDRDASDRVIDEIDERALEVALKQKDADKSVEVVLLTMGPAEAKDGLRKGLSMGADSAVHVLDDGLAGSDARRTASVLAAALRAQGADLIIAGNESTDGRGGVVPALVAEYLGLPLLSFINAAEISNGAVSGDRSTDSGTVRAHAALPAVVSITERSAEARFPNFKGIMTAKRKPMLVVTLGELGVDAGQARSVVVSTAARPARTAGTKIVDEGNAGVQLAEYLASARLI